MPSPPHIPEISLLETLTRKRGIPAASSAIQPEPRDQASSMFSSTSRPPVTALPMRGDPRFPMIVSTGGVRPSSRRILTPVVGGSSGWVF